MYISLNETPIFFGTLVGVAVILVCLAHLTYGPCRLSSLSNFLLLMSLVSVVLRSFGKLV